MSRSVCSASRESRALGVSRSAANADSSRSLWNEYREAFGLNLQDAGQKSAHALTGGDASFPEIFSAGLSALGLTVKGTADATWENDPAITKSAPLCID
jgi:hypothetical protein